MSTEFKVGDKVRVSQSSWLFEKEDKKYTLRAFDGRHWLLDGHPSYPHGAYQDIGWLLPTDPTIKETAVTQFDFDAFNKVLQGSTAICARGKADIAKAVAAGKGGPEAVKPKIGQIWVAPDGKPLIATHSNKAQREFFTYLHSGGYCDYDTLDLCVQGASLTFAAKSLKEYLDAGGMIK
jgi:hypothetical protein